MAGIFRLARTVALEGHEQKGKRMVLRALIVALALVTAHMSSAQAEWRSAGPIWNNMDAQRKCPNVCGRDGWDGGWRTTEVGRESVCNCQREDRRSRRQGRTSQVDAGPIWNNADAQTKCPRVCGGREQWDGNWRTVAPGRSTCDCR